MTDLVVYRSCDRPKYVDETLTLNKERTSNDVTFLVLDNSTDQEEMKAFIQNKELEIEFHQTSPRIGGTQAIISAVELYARKLKSLETVLVIDDDVLVPQSVDGITWDAVLRDMIRAGWDVAAHPWSNDFRKEATIKEIGGEKGFLYSGVNGGCSAFSYAFYKKNPMSQITKIRGYNEWMVRYNRERTGYSHKKMMVFEHIDRPDHPLSLRDTEYCEWSDEMYYERFPNARQQGKTRPKGMRGVW